MDLPALEPESSEAWRHDAMHVTATELKNRLGRYLETAQLESVIVYRVRPGASSRPFLPSSTNRSSARYRPCRTIPSPTTAGY